MIIQISNLCYIFSLSLRKMTPFVSGQITLENIIRLKPDSKRLLIIPAVFGVVLKKCHFLIYHILHSPKELKVSEVSKWANHCNIPPQTDDTELLDLSAEHKQHLVESEELLQRTLVLGQAKNSNFASWQAGVSTTCSVFLQEHSMKTKQNQTKKLRQIW